MMDSPKAMEENPAWKFLRQEVDLTQREDGAKKYSSKRSCWIADPVEGFVAARIRSSKGDQCVVVTDKGVEKTLKKEEIQEMNPPKFEKAEDMSNLTFLNDASVLHNLRQRYYSMLIYTYSGLFCVVINPYKKLPIYGEDVIRMYVGKRRSEMPPHLFAIADEAYRNMTTDRENQSMLITGESGAGKTENTKKVISYFAVVGATQAVKENATKCKATLEEQIVQTNPVLEAFGNAKTVRNNNSSRFGKFIRIYFDGQGKLAGGDIEHYLLEKSRVIKQAPGERCFHIFYQIMSGKIDGLKEKLFLTNEIRQYKQISQAEITIEGVDDKEEMQVTDEAFDIMNFEQTEKDNLYKLCAAVVHMGGMKFKQRPREEQAEADGTEAAECACRLLGVDTTEFVKALLKPRVKVGSEWVNKSQNLNQVTWSVGALSKAVYARTFAWLIQRCNKTLDVGDAGRKFFIGVLDIAGFEIFDFNSFEQLWINFVNEKLQQFFNHHMFVLEQELYKAEGIVWDFIDFGLDLQACIDLIEKPLGIVSMLDEECIVPKATDQTFVQKLNDQHLGKHPHFQKAKAPKGKQSEAHFAIVHYAGTVRYNASGWLEKNKDPLNDSVVSVLKGSTENVLTVEIWKDYHTDEDDSKKKRKEEVVKKKGKAASFLTVSMMYRESLNNLMGMLRTTHPHFIRCIIPNESKKSGVIEAGLVLNQLTCNGVLEGIRICRKGYPNRVPYSEFAQRYSILRSEAAKKHTDPKDRTKAILDSLIADGLLKEDDFQNGLTKVFFKTGIMARLEDLHNDAMAAVLLAVQAALRSYLAMVDCKRRKAQRQAIRVIQYNVRKWLKLYQWPWFRLYGRLRPMLSQAKQQEELEKLQLKLKEFEEASASGEKLCKELEQQIEALKAEKNDIQVQLDAERSTLLELQQRFEKLTESEKDFKSQNEELNEKLENKDRQFCSLKKNLESAQEDNETLQSLHDELQLRLKALESEKANLEQNIRTLKDNLVEQDKIGVQLAKDKRQLEDNSASLLEELKALQEKLANLTKQKQRLDKALDESEEALETEKRCRQDAEKAKRKTEGELKIAQETMEEMGQIRQDLEANVLKKEEEITRLNKTLEDERSASQRLQKVTKELQSQMEEMTEELDQERDQRSKADRRRQELQVELEEVVHQMDEANGALHAQQELTKKREIEIVKLKRDREETVILYESTQSSLQKKHADVVAELQEQLGTLQKEKLRWGKEREIIEKELNEVRESLEAHNKARQFQEKQSKQTEFRMAELLQSCDDYARQVQELDAQKQIVVAENATLSMEVSNLQSQLASVAQAKQRMTVQLEEACKSSAEEASKCQHIISELKRTQADLMTVNNQFEEELEAKSEIQKQLVRVRSDMQAMKTKLEQELTVKTEEADEAKRVLHNRTSAMHEELEKSSARLATVEKVRNKLQVEVEEAHMEIDKLRSANAALERKHKMYDKALEDWKVKCDDLSAELEASQRENRSLNTELYQLRGLVEQAVEKEEAARRECRNLTQELQDITTQLGIGGKTYYEMQKLKHRLELEKEELQSALEDAESALEAEENKAMKTQAELMQMRQEIEQRLREKDEEFEEARRSHARALDSIKASLEGEAKGRSELLKTKKKLESDIADMEVVLDHAHKANEDATRQVRRHQDHVRQLQVQLDEEQRSRSELHDRYSMLEKRLQAMQGERDELQVLLENSERNRRLLEQDVSHWKDQMEEVQIMLSNATSNKHKLEVEMQAVQGEVDDLTQEARNHEEKCRRAMADATRLAEELRQEQEHSQHVEQKNKSLEQQLRDLQALLEENEESNLKGNKKYIQKLEEKVRDLEVDHEMLQRKHQETEKLRRKSDRQVKEMDVQIEEYKKNEERLHELIERLNGKLKAFKRQVEEAEQIASTNLTKYRHIQSQLLEAEERADLAESSLAKIRAKHRSASYMNLSHPLSSATSLRDLARSKSNVRLHNDKDAAKEGEDEEDSTST